MSRVINVRNIPDDLFREFKAECALNDVDMTIAIRRLMTFFTQIGDWEVIKGESSQHYRNLFVAIERAAGEAAVGFSVKKKGKLTR